NAMSPDTVGRAGGDASLHVVTGDLLCARWHGTAGQCPKASLCSALASTHQMNDHIRPSGSVRKFQVEGGLLLLNERSNCLYAYNDTARQVWDLIEAGGAEQ